MKREIKKLTKLEREKIDNKMVVVFATALGSIMLLLYLMNWYRGSGGFVSTARILTYIILGAGIALTILFSIISKKAAKMGQDERSEKYANWKWVTLAAAIAAFIIYPTELISLLRFVGLYQFSTWAISGINRFNFIGHNIASRIVVIMILIGVATIWLFVSNWIYLNKCHRASLNKGSKKA